eukprot:jgi/Mesvir1/25715/Mv01904-RA.2
MAFVRVLALLSLSGLLLCAYNVRGGELEPPNRAVGKRARPLVQQSQALDDFWPATRDQSESIGDAAGGQHPDGGIHGVPRRRGPRPMQLPMHTYSLPLEDKDQGRDHGQGRDNEQGHARPGVGKKALLEMEPDPAVSNKAAPWGRPARSLQGDARVPPWRPRVPSLFPLIRPVTGEGEGAGVADGMEGERAIPHSKQGPVVPRPFWYAHGTLPGGVYRVDASVSRASQADHAGGDGINDGNDGGGGNGAGGGLNSGQLAFITAFRGHVLGTKGPSRESPFLPVGVARTTGVLPDDGKPLEDAGFLGGCGGGRTSGGKGDNGGGGGNGNGGNGSGGINGGGGNVGASEMAPPPATGAAAGLREEETMGRGRRRVRRLLQGRVQGDADDKVGDSAAYDGSGVPAPQVEAMRVGRVRVTGPRQGLYGGNRIVRTRMPTHDGNSGFPGWGLSIVMSVIAVGIVATILCILFVSWRRRLRNINAQMARSSPARPTPEPEPAPSVPLYPVMGVPVGMPRALPVAAAGPIVHLGHNVGSQVPPHPPEGYPAGGYPYPSSAGMTAQGLNGRDAPSPAFWADLGGNK